MLELLIVLAVCAAIAVALNVSRKTERERPFEMPTTDFEILDKGAAFCDERGVEVDPVIAHCIRKYRLDAAHNDSVREIMGDGYQADDGHKTSQIPLKPSAPDADR